MKTKKAIKYILKHPELFSEGDRAYAKIVQKERKLQKKLNEQFDIFKILQLSVADNMKNSLESAFVSLNQQLIEGTLTMNSIGDTFKDMLGGMLRAIQQEVFTTSIAKPVAAGITSLFTMAAGGPVHLAAGGALKRDRVPAMLEPGEFVIRKEAAKKLGMTKLAEMNSGLRPDPLAMLIARLSGSKVRMAIGGGGAAMGSFGPMDPGGGGPGRLPARHRGTWALACRPACVGRPRDRAAA